MRIDSEKVKKLRETRGQTQARFAASCGVGESTIKYWEGGKSRRALPGTVLRVINRLGIRRARILSPYGQGSGPDELPRFLDQQNFPRSSPEIFEAVRKAAVEDMRADFTAASLRYEQALQTIGNRAAGEKAQLLVKYAASLDNSSRFEEAARLLEREFDRSLTGPVAHWARYHLALAYRRIAERTKGESYLDKAEVIFREVSKKGDERQRVAAGHQLGCVLLVRASRASNTKGKTALLRKARKHFEAAAGRWHREGNFREGYSLRRLAEIAALEEHPFEAHGRLLDAFEVFVRHDCYRYAREVRKQIEGLARMSIGAQLPDGVK